MRASYFLYSFVFYFFTRFSILSTELLIIVFLIILNGIFSMSEISILSSRKIRLKRKVQSGSKGAQVALELADEPNRFLSTVQVGITFIGVFTGVYGGTTVAGKVEPFFQKIPMLAEYSGALSLGMVTIVTTYLTLVFGELVPKRIGLQRPETIASALAPLMKGMSKVASPFVWLLSNSTDLILRLLGMNKISDSIVSEEEIKAIIEESAAGGVIDVTEQKMVEQVFRMSDHTVNQIMTSRIDLVWLDVSDAWEDNLKLIKENPFGNFLVCNEEMDTVVGVLHVRDLMTKYDDDKNDHTDLRKIVREPIYVPETMRPFKLLELFKEKNFHFAVVIDEFGTTQGIITMNDILQDIALLSPGSDENTNPQIIKRDDGSYFIDGMLNKNELRDFLEVSELMDEDENYYTTAAGFLMYSLKHVPKAGEHFVWEKIDFEVADMDGNRIDKIIVKFLDEDS